jgi:glycosyltransferase involved in cell wall biosynthesis
MNITAPSLNVQKRIKKYYNRESKIIFHPIEVQKFYYSPEKNYWLDVGRIDPYKRIEIQMKAFQKLPNEKLIIIGDSSAGNKKYFTNLKKNSPKNITFLGPIYKKNKLIELYSECKGFIATALNEDFGMTPVEAMACGKPVIAPNEGGYKETVINGKTGILIDDINEEKLIEAIEKINKELEENPDKYKEACIAQAKKFDTQEFIRKIKEEILKTEVI